MLVCMRYNKITWAGIRPYSTVTMVNTTPEHILDIEDALVCNALASDENGEHGENTLDFQRCVRLHYYLVAYAYMGTNTPDLEALASKSWFFNQYENIDAIRSRLDPPTRTELGGVREV